MKLPDSVQPHELVSRVVLFDKELHQSNISSACWWDKKLFVKFDFDFVLSRVLPQDFEPGVRGEFL